MDVIRRSLTSKKWKLGVSQVQDTCHTKTPTNFDGFANALQKMALSEAADSAALLLLSLLKNSEKDGRPLVN
ncbi:hypothetical protein ACP70R_030304 [Stipagrostis hirtigluma subsp. patula]